MPRVFGARSLKSLNNVHPKLRAVMEKALQEGPQDFTVICGYRDKAGQDAAWKAGATKVKYPNSAHNQSPACAVDVIPYPFTSWTDPAMLTAWKAIADAVMKAGTDLKTPIRCGGDFNRDGNKTTSDAWDKPHFELHPWRSFA
jgi:peptidoglycan L-alanyl-D-glutamate endopeptidase CwlK